MSDTSVNRIGKPNSGRRRFELDQYSRRDQTVQRYFFHLRDGGNFIPDETGMDLVGLDEARREAVQSARDILADQLKAGEALDGQQIEITDDAGRIIEVIRFKDALRPDGTIH